MASSDSKELATNNAGLHTISDEATKCYIMRQTMFRIKDPKDVASAPNDPVDKTVWAFGKPGTVELTHIWGTESDPEFKGYNDGNSKPLGFGHISITVDDTFKACERFERLGVEFV